MRTSPPIVRRRQSHAASLQVRKEFLKSSRASGCGVNRLTPLSKPDGGVRGIVSGDVIRRLVARTIAQQLGEAIKSATAPHQYALSTRAVCVCIAHALQGLCELNRSLTDVGRINGGAATLPFVRMFHGSPSQYLWDDENNVSHTIPQGEGGEQGNAMMPLLFSLGQHEAFQAAHRKLREGESLFAFLDDVVMVTAPDRVRPVYVAIQDSLYCVMQGSGSMLARPRCGTRQACAPRFAMSWRGWHGTTTQVFGFGGGQGCLLQNKESRSWARRWGTLDYVRRFLNKVSQTKLTLRRGIVQHCPCLWAGWAFAEPCEQARPPIGPVGLIVSP